MALKVMLAASTIPEDSQIQLPCMASIKLDGIRSPMVNGTAMSRKMLPIPNRFYQEWAKEYCNQLHGLDGEGIVGLPGGEGVFQRSTSGLMSETGEPDFRFYVFEKWDHPGHAMDRYAELAAQFAFQPIPRVHLLEQRVVNTLEDLRAMYNRALAQGYEGLILKHPRHLYKNGRSSVLEGTLLKWKEWADSEAIILDVNQGTENTNPLTKDELGHAKRSTHKAGKVLKDTVGSFHCKDAYSGVEFNCATGPLTEADLKIMWGAREKLPGRVITYKFQKSGCVVKPRYPGFKAFRSPLDF